MSLFLPSESLCLRAVIHSVSIGTCSASGSRTKRSGRLHDKAKQGRSLLVNHWVGVWGTVSPRATFSDLPVELSEFIILLAVHSRALDDNQTCARLARTSRAIHAFVQPIVADTVSVHSNNRACVCASPDTFASTRRLIVDSDFESVAEKQSLRSLVQSSPAFRKVEMFQGPLWMIDVLLDFCSPLHGVATEPGWFVDSLTIYEAKRVGLSRITHLSGEYADSFLAEYLPGGPAWNPSLLPQLSHLVLGDGDGNSISIMRMLPLLLALPTLEYLCVCVSQSWHDGMSELLAFAQARNEKRLWASRTTDLRLNFSNDPHLIGD